MATATYTAIASITLGSSASSVTFSSIPQDYRDLVLVYNGNTVDSGQQDLSFRLNGDTSNHSAVIMFGTGSSAQSFTQSSPSLLNPGVGNRTLLVAQVMDYSATDKHKTSIIRVGSTSLDSAAAQRYASNTAVTSIVFTIASGTYVAGSTFDLYGIAS